MRELGTIARIQIQESSLKRGERPRRWYDPSPLRQVPALTLTPDGVTAADEAGNRLVDVHHRGHPSSKNSGGRNGISFGFTAHYRAIRRRFGEHLDDGVAGENVLVETDLPVGLADLEAGLLVETEDGPVRLEHVVVAEPCVEFSRYALRYELDMPSDARVAEAIESLRRGVRGFYATYSGEPITLRVGDRVLLPLTAEGDLT
jgi:hypothetical protein